MRASLNWLCGNLRQFGEVHHAFMMQLKVHFVAVALFVDAKMLRIRNKGGIVVTTTLKNRLCCLLCNLQPDEITR